MYNNISENQTTARIGNRIFIYFRHIFISTINEKKIVFLHYTYTYLDCIFIFYIIRV